MSYFFPDQHTRISCPKCGNLYFTIRQLVSVVHEPNPKAEDTLTMRVTGQKMSCDHCNCDVAEKLAEDEKWKIYDKEGR